MIEDLIEEQIEKLKPELRNKFVYRFSNENSNAFADTQYLVPALITFYVKNIEKMTDKPIKQSIRELITHELIHVLQPNFMHNKEVEAQERFQKLRFFID